MKILDKLAEDKETELDVEQIDDDLEAFVYQYQIFSHTIGKFKDYRGELIDFQLTMAELGKEFMKRNSKFEHVKKQTPTTNSDDSQEDFSKRVLDGESGTTKAVELGKELIKSNVKYNQVETQKNKRTNDERSKEDISHGVAEEECVTPKAVKKKLCFAKVTPKADLVPAFKCHLCAKTYGWLKSLSRHLKENHDGAAVEPNLTEVKDYITCRMCKSRQRRDNITRHLLETHKIEKKGAKAVFRGFISFDSINWQPLYFEKGSEDPPRESSVMVPIKIDTISKTIFFYLNCFLPYPSTCDTSP